MVSDLDRLPAFFSENLGELIDVAEGVLAGAEDESTGRTFLFALFVISLDVQFTEILVI